MYHSSMARTLLKWVGWTNVIKQSCKFQNQKISSELSDDIDFFGDTIAHGDGRVRHTNVVWVRAVPSSNLFCQKSYSELWKTILMLLLRMVACVQAYAIIAWIQCTWSWRSVILHWRLLHKTDKKNALCHYYRPIHGDGIRRCFWKNRHTSHN